MDDDLINDEVGIDPDIAAETAASLKSAQLQQVAQTFHNSNEIVLRLHALPLTLLTIGESGKNSVVFLAEAMIRSKRIQAGDHSDAAVAEAREEASRRHREVATVNPSFDPVKSADAILSLVVKQEDIRRPMQALLYSCAVYAWSAVECALKDTWVTAVNLQPFPLGHRSVLALRGDAVAGGITSKQVSVGLLAKHGFDLRDKIGTILAEKYDFTGTDGMRVAYSTAFGKDEIIESALSSDQLSRLEAIRHLIAHRAGLVDEEFLRRTGERQTIGLPLSIKDKALCELINSAISATTTVLRRVDARIHSGSTEPGI